MSTRWQFDAGKPVHDNLKTLKARLIADTLTLDLGDAKITKTNDEGGETLGIEGYMTNSGSIINYNLPEGFYVSAIISGGNADKSELEIGNIITEIDGNKVTSIETIRKVLNKKNKGDKITLKIKYVSRKEYKEKEINVTLN